MNWQMLTSQKVFFNNFISVFDEKVISPKNLETNYGRVHFHRKAASVVVVDFKNRNLLMVGQDRYPIKKYSWETIQGGGGLDDDPLDIAKREMQEEGKITTNHFNLICKTNTSNSVTDEEAYLYWCDKKNTESYKKSKEDLTELIERKWFHIEELVSMINKKRINDALTQISIFYIDRMLNKQN